MCLHCARCVLLVARVASPCLLIYMPSCRPVCKQVSGCALYNRVRTHHVQQRERGIQVGGKRVSGKRIYEQRGVNKKDILINWRFCPFQYQGVFSRRLNLYIPMYIMYIHAVEEHPFWGVLSLGKCNGTVVTVIAPLR